MLKIKNKEILISFIFGLEKPLKLLLSYMVANKTKRF